MWCNVGFADTSIMSVKGMKLNESALKYFDKKILKLNNLNIVDLDHNELEFLQLKGLLDKGLIKPLYLS